MPLPLAQDPASFLASLISVQRSADMPYEARIGAQEILTSICEREERIRREDPDLNDAPVPASDMYAPFIPGRADVREMVMSTNGNGRGHLLCGLR